jgi:tRNA dimethylallyltransferase
MRSDIVLGATATGKSSAAEYLCTQHAHHNKHNYEIVVADSVQAMRYLNIGSNKPSAEVLASIPHHMVNIHDPGMLYSAGEYCQEAKLVIIDILLRGKVPLVVGGNTMVS